MDRRRAGKCASFSVRYAVLFTGLLKSGQFPFPAVAQAAVEIDRGTGTALNQCVCHFTHCQTVITEHGMNVIACQITVQNKNWHLAGGLKEISIIFSVSSTKLEPTKNRASTLRDSRS